jgi:hypothetical protein
MSISVAKLIGPRDANMPAPIELMTSVIDGMIARRFGKDRGHHLTRGQGAGRDARIVQWRTLCLTRFVAGLARASAEHNVAARMSLPLGLRHPADNPRLGCCRQLDVLDSAVAKPLSPLACNALTWNGKPWLGN